MNQIYNIQQESQTRKYLQFCDVCSGFKAPRSHHCRKCGRCVMKMDHHCPYLNCVSTEYFKTIMQVAIILACNIHNTYCIIVVKANQNMFFLFKIVIFIFRAILNQFLIFPLLVFESIFSAHSGKEYTESRFQLCLICKLEQYCVIIGITKENWKVFRCDK